MTKCQISNATIAISIMLGLPLILTAGTNELAIAGSKQGQISTSTSLISLEFQPPGDVAPRDATGGAVRGQVKFQPPGDTAPTNTTGGATRGNVTFLPPTDAAPSNTTGGATRGNITFLPPTDSVPSNTTDGGTRNNVSFQPPEEPAPSSTIGGSTRDERLSKVIPLVPGNNHGRTVSSHPTIYVYVPRTATRKVFFSLQDEQRNQHYQTTLEISGNGGIVSITLPEELPELEIGKNYVWFFAPIEPGDILQPDNYGVTGWVKRVEQLTPILRTSSQPPLEVATFYAGQGIWYDTLNTLVSAKLTQPSNTTLVMEWQELLEYVGLEEIATQPISEQL